MIGTALIACCGVRGHDFDSKCNNVIYTADRNLSQTLNINPDQGMERPNGYNIPTIELSGMRLIMNQMKTVEYATSLLRALGIKAELHAAQQAIKYVEKRDMEEAETWERIRLAIRQQKKSKPG